MAFHVPYATDKQKIPNGLIAGNEAADNPVEFDISPAWGADLARLKSVVIALTGVADERDLSVGNWTPAMQEAVIKAFETGAPAFINTVTAIRGLTIPVPMALRAGIIPAVPPSGPATLVPITTGEEFSRICGHSELTGIALFLAFKIVALTGKQDIDTRFFAQPSGSGGPGTQPATTTTAGSAPSTSRRRGTAASRVKTASQPAGTSPSSPS